VGKGWSIVFAAVMAACFGMFLIAPVVGWWLPLGVSTHSWDVDYLFYVILAVTGFFFVLTEAILVVFMWKYAGQPGPKPPPRPAVSLMNKMVRPLSGVLYTPHRVEMAWTIVPALILLWIAYAQVNTWADVKYRSRLQNMLEDTNKVPLQIGVSARQFEWRLRYPSSLRFQEWLREKEKTKKDFDSFAKDPHADDVHVVNALHVWKGHPVLVQLSTRDVLHSFNLPHFRVKQDALPGKTIPVWFTPTHSNTRRVVLEVDKEGDPIRFGWEDGYPDPKKPKDANFIWDLACAELCGWGHYRMIGRVYVHKDENDFLDWLTSVEKENQRPK